MKKLLSKFMQYGLHASVALFAAAMLTLGIMAPESEHHLAYLGLGIGGVVLIVGMIWIRRIIDVKEGGKES